jgi:hypothetical protein
MNNFFFSADQWQKEETSLEVLEAQPYLKELLSDGLL